MASQYLQMTFAFVLAALIYLQRISIWQILVLSFLTGTAQAFGGPAYQALLPSLVNRKDLTNAIALNSIQFNLARVLGPVAAGYAFSRLGPGACFLLNGFSFVAVIFSLMLLRVQFVPAFGNVSLLEELKTGIDYVRRSQELLSLSTLAFCSTLLGIPLITLLPVFAKDVFQLGAGGYSSLMAISGCGAVFGALLVASLSSHSRKGEMALVCQMVFGVLLLAFSWSRLLWLSRILIFFEGIALVSTFALIGSLVQLHAPESMRGRVVSIYMIAFRGGMPLGSLLSGYLASRFLPSLVLSVNGALMIAIAGSFFTVNRKFRNL